MATKNIRIVGYLPPLSIKAAIHERAILNGKRGLVKIVKQFFDGSSNKVPEAAKKKRRRDRRLERTSLSSSSA